MPDRFELLRRAKDLVVDIKNSRNGAFCRFDAATGWPTYAMKESSGPLPDGMCKIDETAERGISLRQLIVTYEHVKQRCVAEGWTSTDTRRAGELLTPETVTLYDLCNYVIKPATEAHKCSYVELVTGLGEEIVRRCPNGHVPMARTQVYSKDGPPLYTAEEISCSQCAKKLELKRTYWVCHRCGDEHRLCDACAPPPGAAPRAELQRPLWFVSHWYDPRRYVPQRAHAPRANRWGEPVVKFIACLLQHARDRYYIAGDDDAWLDIPYWVCAYANNQHEYAPINDRRWSYMAPSSVRAQAVHRRDRRPSGIVVRQGDGAVDRHSLGP